MEATPQQKAERALQICAEIEAKKQELADLFSGGGGVAGEEVDVPKKRKYTKKIKEIAEFTTGQSGHECCGSKGRRHKMNCPGSNATMAG